MNPDPFTLRELNWMADGKRKDDWNRTAKICVLLAEPNRNKKRKPSAYTELDFHPYAAELQRKMRKTVSKSQGMKILKAAFVRDKNGKT